MALTTCKECGEEISKKATKCPKCGSPAKKKTSLFTWLVVILIAAYVIESNTTNNTTNNTSSSSTTQKTVNPKQIAIDNTKLDFKWTKGGFDNILMVDFTVTNKSKYNIKDLEVKCTHYAKSKTKIDSNKKTIYEVVNANQTKQFLKFNMGFMHSQVDSTSCSIVDLVIAE